MAQESLDAYHQKQESGSLEADREKVFEFIVANGGATIWQAAQHFGVSDNRISGRFIELIREGRIIKSGTVTLLNPATRKRARLYIPARMNE